MYDCSHVIHNCYDSLHENYTPNQTIKIENYFFGTKNKKRTITYFVHWAKDYADV